MASNRPLPGDLTITGMDQASMYAWMANVTDLLNEIQTNYAVIRTAVVENNVDGDATFADLTAIRAAIVGITAKLDADAGVTDTNYAATQNPAALTVTAIAATDPAALTNSTAITLLRS